MLFGSGLGFCLPALAFLGMSAATPEDAGIASGLFSTTQQIGAALGVAVLSTVATARADRLQDAGNRAEDALAAGYRLGFGSGAGLGVAAFLLAYFLLPRDHGRAVPEPAPAELATSPN